METKNKDSQVKHFHNAVISSFKRNGNPVKASEQQRYMKSALPFYGVSSPDVKKLINKELKKFPVSSNQVYCRFVQFFFGDFSAFFKVCLRTAFCWPFLKLLFCFFTPFLSALFAFLSFLFISQDARNLTPSGRNSRPKERRGAGWRRSLGRRRRR